MTPEGFILLGFVVAFNFCVIIAKYRRKRLLDATVDMSLLALFCVLFSGTFSALVTGTIASMFVSIYLWFNPLTGKQIIEAISDNEEDDEWEDE